MEYYCPSCLSFSLADRLFPVRRTLMEMLSDRGFLVSEADIAMTMDQFLQRFGYDFSKEVLDFSCSKRADPSHMVHIFFVEEKLDKTTLEAYINKMDSSNVTRAIFVIEDKPKLSLWRLLCCHFTKRLEVFREEDLVINITRHGSMYEVLTGDEKRLVLEQFKRVSRIPVSHKLARYFDLNRGDVLKVTRMNVAGWTSVSYRMVHS